MKKSIILAIISIIVDLFTKYFIFGNYTLFSVTKLIGDFLTINPVKNTGAAFSFMSNNNLLFIIISILILIYISYLVIKDNKDKINNVAYGLIMGGLIGNLFDRVVFGYVRDFISFRIFDYDFPVFNFADTFIVIGVIIYVINSIKGVKKHENN